MKKIMRSSLFVILVAIFCANFIYKRYQNEMLDDTTIYYLQQGIYNEEPKDVGDTHITVFEEDKYYTYIGITKTKETAEKVRDFYQNNGTILCVKKANIKNREFLNELEQYDILLESAKTFEEIQNILETILATFEETSSL